MRILYLAPNIRVPGTHGGSTHVASVARSLRRRHDVLLVARRGSAEPGVLAVGWGLGPAVRHLMPALYYARTREAVARFRPEVIYERYSAFGLGIAYQRALDVPSVLMTLDRDASPISLRFSDRIVATSSDFIPAAYRAKFREVRWGADVQRFARARGDELRRQLAPRGERIVLYTGSCASWHGLDVVVDVAASWRGPPIRFVIVGDGEDLARVKRLSRARGVEDRIAFVGAVPHAGVPPFVAAADVCIAPYAPARHPIFRVHGMNRDPLKVLEYMAAGRPTVTVDTPRMRVLFGDGEEALLVPPERAEALSAAIAALLASPELAERIGRAGARLVERYGWDQHVDELERIFEETIAERRYRRSS